MTSCLGAMIVFGLDFAGMRKVFGLFYGGKGWKSNVRLKNKGEKRFPVQAALSRVKVNKLFPDVGKAGTDRVLRRNGRKTAA